MRISEQLFLKLPYRMKRWLTTPAFVHGHAGRHAWLSRPQPDIEPWTPNWMSHMLSMCLQDSQGAFLDIGVNRLSTYFDLRSFDQRRQYIGIEPNLASSSIASEVFKLSGDDAALILPCAAAGNMGILSLWVRRGVDHDSCATIVEDLRPALSVERWVAPALPLDAIVASLVDTMVALIKIDVEGGELEVLRGAKECMSRFKPPILCEVLLRDGNADRKKYVARVEELAKLLQDRGYEAFHVEKDAHASKVVGLARIDGFPDRPWSAGDQEACDYLFLPNSVRPTGLGNLSP